jgi:hypothetical protein
MGLSLGVVKKTVRLKAAFGRERYVLGVVFTLIPATEVRPADLVGSVSAGSALISERFDANLCAFPGLQRQGDKAKKP